MRTSLFIWSSAMLVSSACAGPLSQVTADREDYWAYRQVRTAASVDAKLGAAVRYLRDRPGGRWHHEVRRWFNATEPEFFESLGNDFGGMHRYLVALPGGPHSDAAEDRILELERARELASRREAHELAGARAVEARLAQAAAARDGFLHAFGEWIGQLTAIKTWGGRTSDLDGELIYRYRLVEPAARCDTWRCVKTLSIDYAVPEGASLVARRAVFDVILRLEAGGVVAAEISGPELFTRLGEALLVRPIAPDAAGARIDALGRVADLVAASAEPALPSARCERSPTSPVVVDRECDGVRLRMIAAAVADEDDRVVIEAVTAQSSAGSAKAP